MRAGRARSRAPGALSGWRSSVWASLFSLRSLARPSAGSLASLLGVGDGGMLGTIIRPCIARTIDRLGAAHEGVELRRIAGNRPLALARFELFVRHRLRRR